ncbi:hypothetical protein E8E14_011675 [Neopestalotiopsis sp. 37M]|nr:hypothetical protein E8E14_011675 [Neopestalotiopsis sp. 37M]
MFRFQVASIPASESREVGHANVGQDEQSEYISGIVPAANRSNNYEYSLHVDIGSVFAIILDSGWSLRTVYRVLSDSPSNETRRQTGAGRTSLMGTGIEVGANAASPVKEISARSHFGGV